MAQYDLPAMIDFVLEETGESGVHYVAHSQGCLTMFANIAENGIHMEKKVAFGRFGPDWTVGLLQLRSITALAPVITLRHIRGFLKYMAVFTSPLTVTAQAIQLRGGIGGCCSAS